MIDLSRTERVEMEFRCGLAARWLPRVLAAAVLVAAVLAAFRVDPAEVLTASRYLRRGVALFGALAALWIVKKGAEVRTAVGIRGDQLVFRVGARSYELLIRDLERLEYETPFAVTRTWLPALVLRDRFGQPWRVSALISDGGTLIAELLRRTGRSDLATWSETLRLPRKMGQAGVRVAIGYAAAATIVAVGVAYYLH